MKKIYILGLLVVSGFSFGQVFTASYNFAGVTSSTGATDPTTVPAVPGLTMGSFTAINPTVTTPYNSSGAGRFSFTNQPAGATNGNDVYTNLNGALDPTIYFQVTITPNAGSVYNLTGITFTSQRSGTGIRTYSLRSNVDNFAANLPASINPSNSELSVQPTNVFFRVLDATISAQLGSTITLSGSSFTGITTPITFRFYGWNSEGTGGTFSIDDVAISGNVTTLSTSKNSITGLEIYPNPVTGNILNIETAANGTKSVAIFDVLGKQVLNVSTDTTTVNVGNLNAGVYIVKITEEGKTATRKLVVR